MKWIALGVLIMFGCNGGNQPPQEATSVNGSEEDRAGSAVPVVIEAEVTGGGDGSKYWWYDIKPTRVIKNTIGAKLDPSTKVAIQNDMPQIEVGRKYTLYLHYYNEACPEFGLRIVSFKAK